MSVIIIGAGGFLGSHLVAHFQAAGETVHPRSYRPDSHAAFLDALRRDLMEAAPTAVIYAGGSQTARDDPASLHELALSNIVLPGSVAALLRELAPECCLLTFGTSWQIGETGAAEPFNAYAATKAAAEPVLDHFAMDGVRSATLRLYDTYGPGDRRTKVVNLIADAIARRSELAMSSGGQVVELVHISDVLAAVDKTLALLRGARAGRHLAFAVRSGEPVTILEILARMLRLAGLATADFIRPGVHPYRKRERFALFADTPVPPGWAPRVTLDEGLRELLEERSKRVLF